jgi:hypothetical protein
MHPFIDVGPREAIPAERTIRILELIRGEQSIVGVSPGGTKDVTASFHFERHVSKRRLGRHTDWHCFSIDDVSDRLLCGECRETDQEQQSARTGSTHTKKSRDDLTGL